MSRHSKNNTASSLFTAHEKSQLKYGTIKQRLGRESFRDFQCCSLCLKVVVDPKACSHGHLYCKECIFENLLAQKKEIKRKKKVFHLHQLHLQEKKRIEEQQRKEAEIQEFDKVECGVLPSTAALQKGEKLENIIEYHTSEGKKLFLDPSAQHSREAKEQLKKAKENDILPEKKLTAYWVPSLTPNEEEEVKEPSKLTTCPASGHPLKLKQLTTIKFSSNNEGQFQCPVCVKVFTNSSKAIAYSRCGHVTCVACYKKIVLLSERCYVCNVRCPASSLISLESGGTGFAGHHGDKLEAKVVTPAAWL